MEIRVEREKLLTPVSLVAGVVERRQTLPILSYLLLRVTRERITMLGTDLEVEMQAVVEGEAKEIGEVTIPARKLLDICRALPEGAIVVVAKQATKVSVKSGKSRFALSSLGTADFPKVESSDFQQTIDIPAGKLKNILESTAFCMALQDVRYYLNGVFIEIEDHSVRAVATDGHRMAVSEVTYEHGLSKAVQFILPRKAVHEALRLLPSDDSMVNMKIGQNHLQLAVGELMITSKLIDGKFPDYRKVIPAAQTKALMLDRGLLRDALSRTAILANEKYRGVRLNLQSAKMAITAHNPEQEEAIEELEVEYSGEPLEIGFNVNYLLDAVGAIDSEEIAFGLSDASSSCTLKSPTNTATQYIVMPMRL